MEETTDLFVRLDFPGVTKETVKILLEPSLKAVFVFGDAPKEHRHDSSHRKYGTATGLVCDCCVISDAQCYVGDGVVRLILSKKKINLLYPFFCSCNFLDFYFLSLNLLFIFDILKKKKNVINNNDSDIFLFVLSLRWMYQGAYCCAFPPYVFIYFQSLNLILIYHFFCFLNL